MERKIDGQTDNAQTNDFPNWKHRHWKLPQNIGKKPIAGIVNI